jgi:rare lipoprotein A
MDREDFGGSSVWRLLLLIACGFWLSACSTGPRYSLDSTAGHHRSDTRVPGTMRPYQVGGRWYQPKEQPHYNEVGTASWYGGQHQGRPTANGETFDVARISAAHKTLPLPCMVEVTNLANGRKLKVRVNDRGPFVDDRIIDLSRAAADELGFANKGVTKVRVRYIGPAEKRRG